MSDDILAQQRRAKEEQLRQLASRINAWWQSQMAADGTLKKQDLFARYPDLGSDSKFGKFVAGNFEDTQQTLEDWLLEYTTVWNQIEDLGHRQQAAGGAAMLLDTLKGVTDARKAMIKLTQVTTTRRVLSITGESGTGKTGVVTYLQQRWGSRVAVVEVSNVWNDKPNRLIHACCLSVGMKPAAIPNNGADKLEKLIVHLKATRTCLVFEEAHHMGTAMINAVKGLLNSTPGEFVFISIPTLLRRLQHSAWEEARQLFSSHRLFKTITLRLSAADARKLLSSRLGDFDGIAEAAAWLCEASRAPRHGNLGFIRDVADELLSNRERTETNGPITMQDIARTAAAVIEER